MGKMLLWNRTMSEDEFLNKIGLALKEDDNKVVSWIELVHNNKPDKKTVTIRTVRLFQ